MIVQKNHWVTGKRDLKPELLRSPYQDGKFIKVYKEEDVINIARQKAKKTGRYEIIEKILGEKEYSHLSMSPECK